MNNYEFIVQELKNMEKLAKVLEVKTFPIYFLGGSACILGKYTQRATRDFDFIDLNYPANLGKVFRYLGDFDLLEYESTILAPTYINRAKRLTQFNYLEIYILSREDIIVSKIIRMETKDIEDIDILIKQSNKIIISQIIDEVLERNDLYQSKKDAFLEKLPIFKEKYNV